MCWYPIQIKPATLRSVRVVYSRPSQSQSVRRRCLLHCHFVRMRHLLRGCLLDRCKLARPCKNRLQSFSHCQVNGFQFECSRIWEPSLWCCRCILSMAFLWSQSCWCFRNRSFSLDTSLWSRERPTVDCEKWRAQNLLQTLCSLYLITKTATTRVRSSIQIPCTPCPGHTRILTTLITD